MLISNQIIANHCHLQFWLEFWFNLIAFILTFFQFSKIDFRIVLIVSFWKQPLHQRYTSMNLIFQTLVTTSWGKRESIYKMFQSINANKSRCTWHGPKHTVGHCSVTRIRGARNSQDLSLDNYKFIIFCNFGINILN